MSPGLYGTLFESNKESAFAAHKACQALSGFMLFVTAPYLCTVVKIFVVASVLVLALSGYIALEVILRLEKDGPAAEQLVVSAENPTADAKDDGKA